MSFLFLFTEVKGKKVSSIPSTISHFTRTNFLLFLKKYLKFLHSWMLQKVLRIIIGTDDEENNLHNVKKATQSRWRRYENNQKLIGERNFACHLDSSSSRLLLPISKSIVCVEKREKGIGKFSSLFILSLYFHSTNLIRCEVAETEVCLLVYFETSRDAVEWVEAKLNAQLELEWKQIQHKMCSHHLFRTSSPSLTNFPWHIDSISFSFAFVVGKLKKAAFCEFKFVGWKFIS